MSANSRGHHTWSHILTDVLRTDSTIPPSPPSSPAFGQSQTAEHFSPSSSDLADADSVVLASSNVTPYLDKALDALGLHTEARTSFITYVPLCSRLNYRLTQYDWLPGTGFQPSSSTNTSLLDLFLKHPTSALRLCRLRPSRTSSRACLCYSEACRRINSVLSGPTRKHARRMMSRGGRASSVSTLKRQTTQICSGFWNGVVWRSNARDNLGPVSFFLLALAGTRSSPNGLILTNVPTTSILLIVNYFVDLIIMSR